MNISEKIRRFFANISGIRRDPVWQDARPNRQPVNPRFLAAEWVGGGANVSSDERILLTLDLTPGGRLYLHLSLESALKMAEGIATGAFVYENSFSQSEMSSGSPSDPTSIPDESQGT